MKRFFYSLRSRIFLLVTVAVIPALLFSLHTSIEHRQITVATVMLVTALALAFAYGGGHLFILRQTNPLVRAAQAVAGGDLTVRSGVPHRLSELGELARSFDEMAEALQERQMKTEQLLDALRESEERFRLLVEGVKDYAIFMLDPEGHVVSWNAGAHRIEGYDADEVIGRHYSCFYPEEEVRCGKPEDNLRLAAENGVHEEEGMRVRKDGSTFWADVVITTVRDEAGKLRGFSKVMRDVSERKRLELQLLHAQKMEAIGRLTGGIAHDFNNILTAIMGHAGLLEMKMDGTSPESAHVEQILAAADRAAALTRSLLAFSRKQVMTPHPLDLNEIVQRVEKLLERLIGEDIEIRSTMNGDGLTVMADAGQLEQVLMNLATNARDAMPRGGVVAIETGQVMLDYEFIRMHGYGVPGAYALLTFTDTGMGMDEETRKKIFEPFFTTKEMGKGTGLGLSIAYGIVKQHNGYINCYSEPGRGTTFRIYLPLVNAEHARQEMAASVPPRGGDETILLAEDDPMVRTMTGEALEKFGYTVIEAADGDEAVAKFLANRDAVRLAVLDVILPRQNGKEVYKEMTRANPGIRVLFVSGYPGDIFHGTEILDEGLQLIPKPVVPNELLRKVRELLDAESPGEDREQQV